MPSPVYYTGDGIYTNYTNDYITQIGMCKRDPSLVRTAPAEQQSLASTFAAALTELYP